MKDLRTILIILALACLTPRLAAQVQDAEPVDEELLLDTVDALSEDTTFFYEGEDTTEVVMSDADFNDLIEEWTSDDSILPQWLRKLFDGGWGIVALLLVLVIFLFLFILACFVVRAVVFPFVRIGKPIVGVGFGFVPSVFPRFICLRRRFLEFFRTAFETTFPRLYACRQGKH